MRLRALLLAVVAIAPAAAATSASAAEEPAPQLSARAAILIQPDTGDVVYARNADAERPIASATKLMTALITLERMRLSDVVTTVAYHAQPAESLAGLQAGERMTVADLLRAMLLPSANDAAATLAVRVAGTRAKFVALMNQRARQLGLTETHYSTPIGLDNDVNYSSARDLADLAVVLRRNSFFRDVVAEPKARLRTGARPRTVVNRNTLLARDPAVDGVKTGHTSGAGYVLVSSATRDGVTVVSVVLGDPNEATRDSDSLTLLRYGLARYEAVTPIVTGRRLATAKVSEQGDDRVDLVASGTAGAVRRTDEKLSVRLVGVPSSVKGPLPARTKAGTVQVLRRGKIVATAGIETARAVPRASITERLRAWLGNVLTVLLIVALAICSLLLVLLRRRTARRRVPRTRTGES